MSLAVGLSPSMKITDRGGSKTDAEEKGDLEGRKWEEDGGNEIMVRFMTCTLHEILSRTMKLASIAEYMVEMITKLKLNSAALVRERTIPTERPPLVGEDSANFCGQRVSRGQRNGFPRSLISVF
jgi:hypothetical protein